MRLLILLLFVNPLFAQVTEQNTTLKTAQELYNQNKYNESLQLVELTIKSIEYDESSLELSELYYLAGACQHMLHSYSEAIDYFLKAEKINIKLLDSVRLAKTYNSLGSVNNLINDTMEAISYYRKALKYLDPTNDLKNMSLIYHGLGAIYRKNNMPEESLENYQLALNIYIQDNDSASIASVYNNIGLVYENEGNLSTAQEYYFRAYQICKAINNVSFLVVLSNNLGNISRKQQDFPNALNYYNESLAFCLQINLTSRKPGILSNLIRVHTLLNNPSESNRYFEWYVELKDSIQKEERDKKIIELQTIYKTEQSKKELEQQMEISEAKSKQNLLLIAGIFILLTSGSFIYLLLIRRHKAVKLLQLKELELYEAQLLKVKKESDVNSLEHLLQGQEMERKRIAEELHDRIGAKISIAKLLQTEDPANSKNSLRKLLDEIADDCRNLSHNLYSGILEKYGLVLAIEDLFENLNNTKEYHSNFEILGLTDRLPLDLERTLYKIVQELVNNFIKHAKGSELSLKILKEENDTISLLYEDNGIGMNLENNNVADGIGLKNIENRIHLLSGSIVYDSQLGNGTTIIMEFPLPSTPVDSPI